MGHVTAEAAVISLVLALDETRRLTKAIGAAMAEMFEAQANDEGGQCTNWISEAYRIEYDEDGRTIFSNHDGDVAAFLSDKSPPALKIHVLIQERRAARRALGAARRRVSAVGRRLLAEATPEPARTAGDIDGET